ncbi:MAG: tetratricopeptide repeat protein [Candidatus Obscuribacterales bacterium]|nr:tetratricopeptide repeat protein [Candidatus Obscuribacterales bacterium]
MSFSFAVGDLQVEARGKNKQSPATEEKSLTKPRKVESAECAECYKGATRLFANGKVIDALRLMKANQEKCRDSMRFHLLLSTILLRNPGHAKEAALAAATAVELEPTSVPGNLQLGLCWMASGDAQKAIDAMENLVKIDPTSYEAWSTLGTLYNEQHDAARSKSCLAKAAVLEPASRMAKLRTVKNLFKQGKPKAVANELARLITDDSLEPEFFIPLSRDALDVEAYDEAIQAADRALGAYPNIAEPVKTKAIAQFYRRDYADGLTTINQLIGAAREDNEAIAVKALLLLKLGKTRDAQTAIAKLPQQARALPLAGLAWALAAERTGDAEEAIDQLEGTLRHNQIFAPAHIELCRIYLRQGKLEDTRSESGEIARSLLFVSSGKAFESRLALEEAPKRDKMQEALTLARQAIKLDPRDPEAHIALAMCEVKGGKLDSARVAIDTALRIEPGNVDALLTHAKILESEGKSDKSLEALKALRTVANGDGEVLFALSQAYSDKGDFTSALKLLKPYMSEQADPIVIFALAKTHERAGNIKEAKKYFQESLDGGLKGQRALLAKEALKNLGNEMPEI